MQLTSAAAAYQRLRQAIVLVELAPGTPVSESQLMDRFQLSKAAVRAALARLRADGLVRAEARRGHLIAPLTMRDVREIYELRELLEPPAAAAAAGRLAPRELTRLRALCQPLPDVADDVSAERFLQANRTIHVSIAEAGGNARLSSIVAQLIDDSERARLIAIRAGAAEHGLRARGEHHELLAALEEGDGRKAQRLMSTAIHTFREELVAALHEATFDVPLIAYTS